MSLTVAELKAVFSADTKAFDAGLAKMETGSAARMMKIGRNMTKLVSVPLLAIGAASAKVAVDFQSAMTKVHTQAGGSAADVKVLSKAILGLGGKVQQTPVELADAMYHLKSVGLDNAQAMKALLESSKLAAVGGADLEDTTNALAGAWRSGIKGARSFKGAVATLNTIIGAGNMRMSDLTAAMSTGFLASARSFGLSLKDVGSALALMTDEGVPARMAATRLRMSFSLLGAPSKVADKNLQSIGLSGLQLAKTMRKPDGLMKTIELLKSHLKGLSAPRQSQLLSRTFGGGQSSSAILTLINNLNVLKRKEKQVGAGTTGNFTAAVAAQAKTTSAQLHELESSLETTGVEIGTDLLPMLLQMAGGLKGLVGWFSKLSPGTQKWVVKLGLIAAAVGPIMMLVAGFVRAAETLKILTAAQWLLNLAMDANPIGIVIVALAALAAGLFIAYKKSATVRQAFSDMGQAAKWLWDKAFKPAIAWIVGGWLALIGVIVNGAAKAFGWVPGIGPRLKKVAGEFDAFAAHVNASLRGIHNQTVTLDVITRKSAGKKVNKQLGGTPGVATGGYVSNGTIRRAVGGLVRGMGGPTSDSIPAWLSNGEFVVNARSTRANLPLLRKINGFAGGGVAMTNSLRDRMAAGNVPSTLVQQTVTTLPGMDAKSVGDAAADRIIAELATLGVR